MKLWTGPVRILLDTNIIVAGFISSNGPPARLIRAWLDRQYELVTSDAQIEELARVLQYPKLRAIVDPVPVQDFWDNIEVMAILADDLPDNRDSPDPDDNLILATAIAGEADYVVSGDKSGMLDLGDIQGIPILRARDALKLIRV